MTTATSTHAELEIAAANLWDAFTALNSAYISEAAREEDTSPSRALALANLVAPRIAAVYNAVAELRQVAQAQLKEGGR